MTRPRRSDDDNPAAVCRGSLSRGSYWAVHHSLGTIVKHLGDDDPWTYPWHRLRYRATARVRAQLVERYAPATVNKILSALRGVLKTCWRLGLMDAETHARAADLANVRAKTLPSGRAVERDEVRALFAACDDSPAGRRDAAMLAILYGGGLRRAEVCGLDVADFDAGDCVLTVRAGKGRRDRRVFLSKPACRLVKRWIKARGGDNGPLFCPVSSTGTVRHTRLRGEAVRYILQPPLGLFLRLGVFAAVDGVEGLLGLVAGVGQAPGGVGADCDPPLAAVQVVADDEGLAAAVGDADAEAGQALVPVVGEPLAGDLEALEGALVETDPGHGASWSDSEPLGPAGLDRVCARPATVWEVDGWRVAARIAGLRLARQAARARSPSERRRGSGAPLALDCDEAVMVQILKLTAMLLKAGMSMAE